jgi:glycosyltransferase involved in cell wall biosynthesis
MRSLPSLAPWISSYCIVDTGSTDGTKEYITKFFDEKKIPGIILDEPFENFEQARNIALDHARSHMRGVYDYLLLSDADMDLVVDDSHCFDDLTAPVYLLLQKNGNISYYNARLLRHDVPARYLGVTHEYLDFGGGEVRLSGCWFDDRATGSSHDKKALRDLALLEKGLADHPDYVRYMFYLAQTYAELGRHEEAIELYERRALAGGWEEEVFMSFFRAGKEYKILGRDAEFIRNMLAAHNARPIRAEPFYELARYYRDRENNNASVLFSEKGMTLPRPGDLLFIEDHVYTHSLREEFSICGFYNPATRRKAFGVCDGLALDPKIPEGARNLARSNLFHYLQPLKTHARSFEAEPVWTGKIGGYTPMNPSVCMLGDQMVVNVRTVNYRITESGHYDMQGDTAIRTRNWLIKMDDWKTPDNFGHSGLEMIWQRSEPQYDQVIGAEDVRLFPHGGGLYGSATVRERNREGWCEQWLFKFSPTFIVEYALRMSEASTEKNWSPILDHSTGDIAFMYTPGVVRDPKGAVYLVPTPSQRIYTNDFRGSSQLIPFNGGWLAIVHEATANPGNGQRCYWHRFVWYDHELSPAMVSRSFVFLDRQIEFCAGLCRPNANGKLVMSFGVRDCEAWMGTLDGHDVWDMLHDGSVPYE